MFRLHIYSVVRTKKTQSSCDFLTSSNKTIVSDCVPVRNADPQKQKPLIYCWPSTILDCSYELWVVTKVAEIKHAKLLARLVVHEWVIVSKSQGSNSASEELVRVDLIKT